MAANCLEWQLRVGGELDSSWIAEVKGEWWTRWSVVVRDHEDLIVWSNVMK